MVDKIYDINSVNFIDKMNKTKCNIEVENFDAINTSVSQFQENETTSISTVQDIEEQIKHLFFCNMLINRKLYTTMLIDKECDDLNKSFNKIKRKSSRGIIKISIDVGVFHYHLIDLYKINSKYYEYKTYCRKYIPYLLKITQEKDYYLLNRDYEYIGLQSKSIDHTIVGEYYLFNDDTKPWDKIEYFEEMCKKYGQLLQKNKLKNWLNVDILTQNILTDIY